MAEGIAMTSLSRSPNRAWQTLLETGDAMLPAAWALASIVLLIAIGIGQRRLRRERARAAELSGFRVLLTEAIGPAVAGIREPVVLEPSWVAGTAWPRDSSLRTSASALRT